MTTWPLGLKILAWVGISIAGIWMFMGVALTVVLLHIYIEGRNLKEDQANTHAEFIAQLAKNNTNLNAHLEKKSEPPPDEPP